MSDEGPDIGAANDPARDGGDTEDGRGSGRTAVVTKPVTPQRPTGKRSRQRVADADEVDAESTDEVEAAEEDKAKRRASKADKAKKAKKPKKAGDRPANPFVFVYSYLKQVVAEMRKVIWPNRKQMLTYTSVVLAFLAFMVALVGLADFGLTKLVLLVFG
ncbi:preprotein translocase subunit SecE [Mycobacterium sp. 852002-51057_SCH5723018]|uniref:preprotein translocase subunit SecE n=1 Tax=Mycobacterium sp. 852002-51057_SCH5723018 TaxID=1834094 RepID=UPI000800BBCB|nr:preprotein translocase subunit SecE [Mycobacterium sp. 852002-51057_SCH5723018]OBG28948.1 preprotein translocase subunit SecE [Mycobacterium sp. 852002-51057_SCH5723018]